MKVKELKALLNKFDDEADIMTYAHHHTAKTGLNIVQGSAYWSDNVVMIGDIWGAKLKIPGERGNEVAPKSPIFRADGSIYHMKIGHGETYQWPQVAGDYNEN